MEARINAILKGLRKFKNPGGDLKILHFEKLPDKTVMPEYYHEIKNPIAMDLIKRKAKRKKYQSVDQAMKDLELMFENAKAYNLEDSQVYRDAVDLQREARALAEQEKKKPDSDFVDEDGRLPLPEILHNGEIWKVGRYSTVGRFSELTKFQAIGSTCKTRTISQSPLLRKSIELGRIPRDRSGSMHAGIIDRNRPSIGTKSISTKMR
jgi:chromatin structure-remodeling complex subunit RSC1/2